MWVRVENKEIVEIVEFNPKGKFVDNWEWIKVPDNITGVVNDVPHTFKVVNSIIQPKEGVDPYEEVTKRPNYTKDQLDAIASFNRGEMSEEDFRNTLSITATEV